MKAVDLTVSFMGTVVRGVLLVVCAVVVINVGKKAYDFGFRIFTEGPVAEAPGRDIIMSVDKGEGLTDVSKKLEEKGITSDWMLFFIQAKLSEYKGKIEPGTYTLNNSLTTDELMAILTKAETEKKEGESDEYIPDELTENLNEADQVYDSTMPVQSGSDLVEGDLEEGETPYEGEDGEIDIEIMTDDSAEPAGETGE
ncbi:MAG: endolytic transglycosylase MltG [Lachnospiraceae bacterium]|nr:endolytic transglycosylase MltG [Lachnospiraceae bacterium]